MSSMTVRPHADSQAAARLRDHFPGAADLLHTHRRQFMRVMAASLALGGLAGCNDDDTRDDIVPPVQQSQGQAPGETLTYASATLMDGFANGVRVTTRDGRPLKIEGNPQHPWSQGGTDVFGQASVLGLYDPFRSQTVTHLTRDSDWPTFRGAMVGRLAALRASGGAGLAILLGPVTSPTLAAQIAQQQGVWPKMRVYSAGGVTREAVYEGTQRAFGQALETHYDFSGVRVAVCLDGDLLDAGPHQVGTARRWAAARRKAAAQGGLLTLFAAGPVPNLTSAKADHAICASPALIDTMARALLAQAGGGQAPALPPQAEAWCAAVWAALDGARGAGVVQAGVHASPAVQECVHRLNAALGNTGRTVLHTDPVLIRGQDLRILVADVDRGDVHSLLILGANPVYESPGDVNFAALLGKVSLCIHAGMIVDETAQSVDWHLPMAHPLESWGDARSVDGTASLIQPTIAPLYDGKTASEILSLLFEQEPRSALEILRAHWAGLGDAGWRAAQLSGVLAGGGLRPYDVQPTNAPLAQAAPRAAGFELLFRPDPTVWDGAWADNAWLQELPKPLTKITWENVVGLSPATAAALNVANGDHVVLRVGAQDVEGPVWVIAGQDDGVVSVTLGYGRRVEGQLSAGLGFDAYRLRRLSDPWGVAGVAVHRTGRTQDLACTQSHTTMEGHDFIRVQTMGAAPVGDGDRAAPTLYAAQEGDGRAWGMVIDLDACIGCNACITACQAENNIAVVGRDAVLQGREMQWLRVDVYADARAEAAHGGGEDAAVVAPVRFQPVPCMQCEQAPCEVGCPVEATLHDHEGLNLMVYNRCIGTRACSGYCPYKVRRFNWTDYSAGAAPSMVEQRNPDVTVRARGVMEKCTYCVQRIVQARIVSDRDDTPIADGAVITACQGACPTGAIVFGDLARKDSAVARAHADPRRYALLGELNTRPRTTYLAAQAPALAQRG